MSERIASKLIDLEIVDEEDRELYVFGVREFFSLLCSFSLILVIGVLMNLVLESTVFTCAYLPVRIYAGGYHAPTQGRCYVLSLAMVVIALLVIGHADIPGDVSMMVIVISSIFIYVLSPSEHKNKPLSETERRVYKQRVGKILIVLDAISCIVMAMTFEKIVLSVAVALLMLLEIMILTLKKEYFFVKRG